MRIDVGLPEYLWPQILKIAGYIANRTPMAKHRLEMPHELVIGKKLDLSHLHVYGCKTYPQEAKAEGTCPYRVFGRL